MKAFGRYLPSGQIFRKNQGFFHIGDFPFPRDDILHDPPLGLALCLNPRASTPFLFPPKLLVVPCSSLLMPGFPNLRLVSVSGQDHGSAAFFAA